jgi:predicted dehydrogenase
VHARKRVAIPAFDLGGIWDPSTESIAKTRETMANVPFAIRAEAAMAGADVDYLACPPAPSDNYALKAAAAGQGVFMEKSMCTDNA